MEKRHFKQAVPRFIVFFIGIAALTAPGLIAAARAQQALPAGINQTEKIKISADNLTVDNESRFAEFSGSVKAQQGDTVILADTLRIFYKSGIDDGGKKSSGEDAIEKIVANGNVKIRFENRVAVSDEAVYITSTQKLTLSGPNTKITSGNDSISGSKITLYRNDGRINIESNEADRVEAIFYPGKGGGLR